MTVLERDYYTDRSVLLDPYEWFEEMRAKGSVCRMANRDLVLVTGFDEAVEILNNNNDWSNAISVSGPLLPPPFEPAGDDITHLIEAHRPEIPLSDLLVAKGYQRGRDLMWIEDRGGVHNEAAWGKRLRPALPFLLRDTA